MLTRSYRTHYPAVAGYLARRAGPDAVDDLVDEVFLVAWRRLDQVPAQARPWLLGVASNVWGLTSADAAAGARWGCGWRANVGSNPGQGVSASRLRPTPSIQTSLLTVMPADVGQMLPGAWRAGVRRYKVNSPPAKAVSAAPATLLCTNGVSNAVPVAISAMDSAFRKVAGGTLARNGYAPEAVA
jgi:hypothetical protein